MTAQFAAKSAAIGMAAGRQSISGFAIRGIIIAIAAAAAGCTPATTRIAGADPADPAAGVAGVGHHSTVTPYTALRPSTPAPWRERNDAVAPKARRGQP
jgi:hypothetical protein